MPGFEPALVSPSTISKPSHQQVCALQQEQQRRQQTYYTEDAPIGEESCEFWYRVSECSSPEETCEERPRTGVAWVLMILVQDHQLTPRSVPDLSIAG
mmetsp:Transcript_19441/g.45242  ORF Transcript_19441/g.45242 Transcript_19441/m.45242 type:complete len:98 (+) Transcript_19441:296-589(+)